MKKIIALIIAGLMVLSFAACGSEEETTVADETTTEADSTVDGEEAETDVTGELDAVGVLSAIFADYAEDKSFPIGGGDEANMNVEGPGKYDISLVEELNVVAHLPASQNGNVTEAANVMNMMNANSFSGAAYLLKEGTDASAFAADFKDELDNAQWLCGFPEKFVVIKVGDYVVTAYGLADNIEYFKTQAASALTDSSVVLEGDIAA